MRRIGRREIVEAMATDHCTLLRTTSKVPGQAPARLARASVLIAHSGDPQRNRAVATPHPGPAGRLRWSALLVAAALTVSSASGCVFTGERHDALGTPAVSAPARTSPTPSSTTPHRAAPAAVVRSWSLGGFLDGIANSRGVLWVSDLNGDRLVRVDSATGRRLADIPLAGGPLTVAANDRSVWVASYKGFAVTRYDSRTGHRTASIRTPSLQPCAIALTSDRVWVFDQSDGNGGVAPLRAATLHPLTQPAHAGYASAGFGAIWVPDFTGGSSTVSRLDIRTHRTRTVVVGAEPIQALAAGDSVWVSNTTDSTVSRINPDTLTSRVTITVPGGQSGGLAYAHGLVWVTSYRGNLVAAIDPATDTVVGTVAVPGPAENIAVDPRGRLWVTQSTGILTELQALTRPHTSQ